MLNPLAWLLGLLLPACGAIGAQGVPRPATLNLTDLHRPSSPNTALAAPAGFVPAPDIVLSDFANPAQVLWAAVGRAAAAQPRTYPLEDKPAQMEGSWVARSALLNFPDIVNAQALPSGEGKSQLILYSHSVYGYSDFGVNRRRLQAWLSAIGAILGTHR